MSHQDDTASFSMQGQMPPKKGLANSCDVAHHSAVAATEKRGCVNLPKVERRILGTQLRIFSGVECFALKKSRLILSTKLTISNKAFLISAEGQSPGDFLTCGGCKKKFVLSDLTKFVQHKLLECTKEKTGCDSEDEEEKEQNVRHKSLGSPSISGSGQVDDEECSRIKSEGEERDRKPSVRDNGANTVKSGMLSGSTKDSSDNVYEISMLILSMSQKPFLCVLMFETFYEIS